MNEIASVSNGNDDKLALVTPEKKKANPYRNKKMLKHPNGYSDSFKRREEKARCLNKKENDMKEEKRFQREMKQFWDDIDENELLCMMFRCRNQNMIHWFRGSCLSVLLLLLFVCSY